MNSKEHFFRSKKGIDKQIRLIVITIFIALALCIIIFTSFLSIRNAAKDTKMLLENQNRTLAEFVDNELNDYTELAFTILMNNNIQNYLSYSAATENGYFEASTTARNLLETIMFNYENLSYLALTNEASSTYIYQGHIKETVSHFIRNYKNNYLKAKQISDSNIKIGYSDSYDNNHKEQNLTIFFPAYTLKYIGADNGMLCMNFKNNLLEMAEKYIKIQTYTHFMIVDKYGEIVGGEKLNDLVNLKQLKSGKGQYNAGNKICFYTELSHWPYYIVGATDRNNLYKESITLSVFIAIFTFIILAIAIVLINHSIRTLYNPVKVFVSKMEKVSVGDMSVRMDVKKFGPDLSIVAKTFNSMMDDIDNLLTHIKAEEQEIADIQLKMLQSQIKPHFLYNTLECLHWQAKADGNEKTSTLIKALAKYYRICLSDGNDIIPLKTELENIKNYMIIQNFRYGDIVTLKISIDKELQELAIPKLTLQPIVENAIYHGIRVREGMTGEIFICGKTTQTDVFLWVEDNGIGMDDEAVAHLNQELKDPTSVGNENEAFGVTNVHRRIKLLYGIEYGLSYNSVSPHGICVSIHLPAQKQKEVEINV